MVDAVFHDRLDRQARLFISLEDSLIIGNDIRREPHETFPPGNHYEHLQDQGSDPLALISFFHDKGRIGGDEFFSDIEIHGLWVMIYPFQQAMSNALFPY